MKASTKTQTPITAEVTLRDVLTCIRTMRAWLKKHPEASDAEYVFNKLLPKYERAFIPFNHVEHEYKGKLEDVQNKHCMTNEDGSRKFQAFKVINQFGNEDIEHRLCYTPAGAVAMNNETRAIQRDWDLKREQLLDQPAVVPCHYFDVTPFKFTKTELAALQNFCHDNYIELNIAPTNGQDKSKLQEHQG